MDRTNSKGPYMCSNQLKKLLQIATYSHTMLTHGLFGQTHRLKRLVQLGRMRHNSGNKNLMGETPGRKRLDVIYIGSTAGIIIVT